MFGFFSFLPFSTVDTIYYNGKDSELILCIQQSESNSYSINYIITMDLTVDKNAQVIIWKLLTSHCLFNNNPI